MPRIVGLLGDGIGRTIARHAYAAQIAGKRGGNGALPAWVSDIGRPNSSQKSCNARPASE